MKTFEDARKAKFDKGAKEHSQPWTPEAIGPRHEIQEECLDLYNYAGLLDDEELKREIQGWAKYIWTRMHY